MLLEEQVCLSIFVGTERRIESALVDIGDAIPSGRPSRPKLRGWLRGAVQDLGASTPFTPSFSSLNSIGAPRIWGESENRCLALSQLRPGSAFGALCSQGPVPRTGPLSVCSHCPWVCVSECGRRSLTPLPVANGRTDMTLLRKDRCFLYIS